MVLSPVDKNVQLFARPDFLTGRAVPNDMHGKNGDYYLNTSTGKPYFKSGEQWIVQPGTVNTDNQSVQFNDSPPTSSLKNGAYYMDTSNPKSLTLYKGSGSKPVVVKAGVAGPGYVVSNPKYANMSAIKIKGDKPYLLWIGGATVAMGFIGFILTTIFSPKGGKPKQTKN